MRARTLTLLCLSLLVLAPAAVAADEPDPAEAKFLAAGKLFRDGKHREAITALAPLAAGPQDGPWYRKARFLTARAHVELREYEAAEKIYEVEAERLLSEDRKREIAGLIVSFADALAKKPDPDDPGAPEPDYRRAGNLYRKALEMEIGRALRDEVMFKSARTFTEANDHQNAIRSFQAYLKEFDPDWTGPVGSAERRAHRKRKNPPPAGSHIHDARFGLAKSQIAMKQFDAARRNLEDLLTLLPVAHRSGTMEADALWQILRTWQLPRGNLERGVKAARKFLDHQHADPRRVAALWLIAESYRHHGRADQAIATYTEFGEFTLAPGTHDIKHPDLGGRTAREWHVDWTKLAVFHIGQIRFSQKEYARAIETFKLYVNRFPNGPNWADAQRGIIDAEFQHGLELIAAKEHDRARDAFAKFLAKYPLDARSRQILFLLGQMPYAAAIERCDDEGTVETKPLFAKAVAEWEQLVSKYPNTQESSLALYRIGTIQEEHLGELEKALASYRRLTWGNWAAQARARIAALTKKHLALVTERKFRTDETAVVEVSLRNIEKLKVRRYTLDLEAYFRKTHGTGKVEDLDVALIQPDKTWEVTVDGYRKYAPSDLTIDVPFPEGKAGVCLINVSEEDLEATTLVLRSDLDLIVRTSREEVLVFAQDMRRDEAAAGVELLLSDGEKVFKTAETGKDGVYRGRLDDLKDVHSVRVFAKRDGSVASNGLDLRSLRFGTGLAARGYLYTDRPAYRPGQTARLRGVIRDIGEGSFVAPAGAKYVVAVADPQGRLIWEEPVTLSEFGTFHTSVALDPAAPRGTYVFTARTEGKPVRTYRGPFLVEDFVLQKMRLNLEVPQEVYFRGETVKLEVRAEYYWGEPVTGRDIRYWLPDGRSYVERPDEEGKLAVEFDTTGVSPGSMMQFRASIEGESVVAAHRVLLARSGFGLKVAPARPLALSGEPFDVEVTCLTPTGKPVGKTVQLLVLRRKVPEPDPVLSGVPWIPKRRAPASEVTVSEHRVVTDADSGLGTVRLTLEAGGDYVLRASAEDRFEQTVVAEGRVRISAADDATKLRFFADSGTLRVGERTTFRLHSRIDGKLMLLTFDGDDVLEHRVMRVAMGMNEVRLDVDHVHFPNFAANVALLDGKDLRTAGIPFKVERELKVTVTPGQEVYRPGETGKVRIRAVDQLGRPVKAELSLALVDEALFALFPDRAPKILEFFQKGAVRRAMFRVAGSSGFRYEGRTRGVVKAFLEEEARKGRQADEKKQLEGLRKELAAGRRDKRYRGPAGEVPPGGRDPADTPPPEAPGGPAARPDAPKARWGREVEDQLARQPEARREVPEAGFWLPAIVTGDDGTAEVEVPMPGTTTKWRLTARGVSVETLVGEASAGVVTRKEFFVTIKAPASLSERDNVRVLARIHNLSEAEGAAELTLTVRGGPALDHTLLERRATARIDRQGGAEVLFEAFEVPPELGLEIRVSARLGDRMDAIARPVVVRPWGVELVDHGGGTARSDAAVGLELPADRPYRSRWLTVTVGPSLERAVIEMALGTPIRHRGAPPPRFGGHAASDLLAVVRALEYARAVGAPVLDHERLRRRARALVGTLVVTQGQDGGWSHGGQAHKDEFALTARACWALSAARKAGLVVNANTLARAKEHLKNLFRSLQANDNDGKAMILHALSTSGDAEFAHANRLYRERTRMSLPALAHTALAFVNLGRKEIAGEILDVILAKTDARKEGVRELCSWHSVPKYAYQDDRIETTSLTLLLLLQVRPQSPRVRPAVDFLLDRRGAWGFTPAKARGPAVAAVAGYFAKGKFADTDSRVRVLVGGREVGIVTARSGRPLTTLEVPADGVPQGKVIVSFRHEGRGEYTYSATLRGFSHDVKKDAKNWNSVNYIRRAYYHANLRYRGRDIGVSSSSKVRNIEVGQRIRVHVDIDSERSRGYWVIEEPIPSGFTYVADSIGGRYKTEVRDGKLVIYIGPRGYVSDLNYQLVAYATGNYPVLPTVLRDAQQPSSYRVGTVSELTVLPPGEESDDSYTMNLKERFMLGKLMFEDGLFPDALEHLTAARKMKRTYNERDVARMLLWIYTSPGFYDAHSIVEVFEVLRERYPALEIPFDKILVVGRAYRDIGEYERAFLVFRATIDASFVSDAGVSAVLEDEGQFLGSVDYQEDLWREYPDTAEVVTAYFALSQALYRMAPKAHELAKQERRIAEARGEAGTEPKAAPDRISMLTETIRMLERFLALYPKDPLADDAAFSMANAFLDLKQYETVVALCGGFQDGFAKSDFSTGFRYMEALGHFWQQDYDAALGAAVAVGEGESKDRDFARYIVGQIHHANGKPADAITWYEKVKKQYPDASEAIAYFEEKRISLPEVTVVKPGDPVELELTYRNIREASYQVYRVDLMKLYLREKNLSNITRVHLAGIRPELTRATVLGDGKDYVEKKTKTALELTEEAAYLVICRGDDLFTSGLVLITPLEIEAQEEASSGRVRVNVLDRADGGYAPEVHVKAIGSADAKFKSGETDLRGIYVADGLRGKATVIARAGESRYAFYRGERWLGAPEHQRAPPKTGRTPRGQKDMDYRQNLRESNRAIQDANFKQYDQMRRTRQQGVQIQNAR